MTDREAFEAWLKTKGTSHMKRDGHYVEAMARLWWDCWQAARAQPAQAVPVLTSEDIWGDDRIMALNAELGLSMGQLVKLSHAIEQAVRAKMGVAVPMTPKDYAAAVDEAVDDGSVDEVDMWAFIAGIKAAERHHGIVGKEGV